MLDLSEDLSYPEFLTRILDEAEYRTRNKAIKFLKVQWSNHSEDEATWEREDRLREEYPTFFLPTSSFSGQEFLLEEENCNTPGVM